MIGQAVLKIAASFNSQCSSIASCADLGSLEIGVDDFTLYNCDMFKQQYHQHLLVYQEMLVIHKHNIKHTLLSHNSVCLILCL